MATENKQTTSSRYDILFEPVQIGPVTAKNRFYQVPHCNGAGYRDPSAAAEMRRVKAEGGWAVVFTEQVEMHHTSEITPYIELRLWDDRDIPALARMSEKIHEHDALAGIELTYSGVNGPNLYSREVPRAPSALPVLTFTSDPIQARAMTKRDIRDLRRWYRNAFRRSKIAGYDLICLYGAHGFGVIQHFLSRATNHRSDEYGGSLENRARLMREIIEDAKDEVGDSVAITVRLSLQELIGEHGFSNAELRDVVEMHKELPDLWDLAHGAWEDCSSTSRFSEEASQAELIRGIRQLTPRPIVGVGRFTSPDTMVRHVRDGVLDFIGAARPSIADPFLPQKIQQDRLEDIRECIGCNICVSGDMTMSLSRCTQNPTFMEEWRKGWHPENIDHKGAGKNVLIVGAGPAGLEAARALGQRGYDVALAEAGTELGGRVALESQLPGLSAWGRVRDYREGQISQMANVDVYFESELNAQQIIDFGFEHVAIATGSSWRLDGVGRFHTRPIPVSTAMKVLSPDDLMAGRVPSGRVLIYDDDHYYMGGVLAELLVKAGASVSLLTPSSRVSEWTVNTLEQSFIQARLLRHGVNLILNRALKSVEPGAVTTQCAYTGDTSTVECDAVVLVTSRTSNDSIYHAIEGRAVPWGDSQIRTIKVIGDAEAPAAIAWAVSAGHRYARELDEEDCGDDLPFRREITQLLVD